MVHDILARSSRFASLGPAFNRAFAFLERDDLAALPVGTHEIDGSRLYALVQDYQTKPAAEGKWEAHRKDIDLQYVVSGRERFGCAPGGRMTPGQYDESRDFEAPVGDGAFVELRTGEFILLWPSEPHMPGMALGQPAPVRKIVLKIAI